jgi:hypothetical protein
LVETARASDRAAKRGIASDIWGKPDHQGGVGAGVGGNAGTAAYLDLPFRYSAAFSQNPAAFSHKIPGGTMLPICNMLEVA